MLNPYYRSHSQNKRPNSKTAQSNQRDFPKIKQYANKVAKKNTKNENEVSMSQEQQEGLLGSHKTYQMMDKEELIQKLLTTEQLLKRLYKENKQLKDKIRNDSLV